MIRRFRKWLLQRRINAAVADQRYWQSGIRISTAELANARVRESALRQELIAVDFKLPRILRSRGLT